MAEYPLESGVAGIRAEVIDSMVKQTAAASYKFKQAVAVVPTSAWNNTFFRENLTVPAGKSGNATKGIPRGSNFPQYTIGWQEVTVKIVKHGLEENIPWEDILSDTINVQTRTVIRLTEGVVKSVDDDIYDVLSDTNGTGSGDVIQSFAIAGRQWNVSSAAIIDDLMQASELISTNGNYDTSNLIAFVSPKDHRSIKNYLADKGAQWQGIATDVATNGRVGKVAGITLVESNSVPASFALVVKPKTCATWKELVSLRSTTIDDPYKSLKIRVVEEGVVELTDPKAICLIKNTQA